MIFRARHLATSLVLFVVACWFVWRRSGWSYPSRSSPQRLGSLSLPRELVVASQAAETTTWIDQALASQWNTTVYTVDDESALWHVPRNKGKEAMVYLSYIIERYDTLPAYVAFIHAGRYQWHNDDPNYDSVSVLRSLRLDTLAKRGYLNLRCTWNQGCPSELELASLPDRHADEEFDTRTETAILYKASFKTLFPESDVPDVVAASCCSQFAVTKAKILERPKADYERYREWLLDTPLDDNYSGRVFEYSWHIIFGMPAKHCPDEQACYCDTFGLCDLRCTEKGCGWYKYPFGPDRSYFDRFKDWLGV